MNIKVLDHIISRMENEAFDLYSHSERTSLLCYAVAKELDLYPEELEQAYFAGLLHEIGKLDFREEQMGIVNIENLYPYFTASILNNCEGYDKLSKIILQYKENYDGTGEPQGLKEDEINIIAKILRIADFYDEKRASGLTHDETTKLLREYSDKYFPRRIITPFIKAIIKNDLQNEYQLIK